MEVSRALKRQVKERVAIVLRTVAALSQRGLIDPDYEHFGTALEEILAEIVSTTGGELTRPLRALVMGAASGSRSGRRG